MPNLELIALAIAPGLAIGIYIFWKDKWEKEPLQWLLFAFLLGALSVIPTVIFSVLAQLLGSEPQSEQIWHFWNWIDRGILQIHFYSVVYLSKKDIQRAL
jgi:RsiW-degrading membrane proteinase PrsW (M82 family)